MKKIILSTCLLFLIANGYSQIGINTDFPLQMLHVDAKKNTEGTANIADDVVIDNNGNIGIGVLNPTAKLHINATTVGGGLKLKDGTEGARKMLYSKDANGRLSWINQPSSSGKIYYANTGPVSFPVGNNQLVLSIPITETGTYIVFMRWWGSATHTEPANKHISAYFRLREANTAAAADVGTEKDALEHYVDYPTAGKYFVFTSSLLGYMTAGKHMKIYISVATPIGTSGYKWQIGVVGDGKSTTYNPSFIVFKI